MDFLSPAASGIILRQLQYFVAVADDENYTRAAERLFISQPSLSRQVKELEEALGVSLFVRDARGVRLTEAGRELLGRARAILAMLQGTVEAVRSAEQGERLRLRLGYYGPSFYNNVVTRVALERFRAEAPEVEIVSHELFSEEHISALREERIDVAISRGVVRPADLKFRVIAEERLVVLLPESDALASKSRIALADLAGRSVISFPERLARGFNHHITRVAAEAGVALRIAQEVTQLPTLIYSVSHGDSISILAASSVIFPSPGVVWRAISDQHAKIELLAVTRKGEQSPTVLRFLRLLAAPADDASGEPDKTAHAGAASVRD